MRSPRFIVILCVILCIIIASCNNRLGRTLSEHGSKMSAMIVDSVGFIDKSMGYPAKLSPRGMYYYWVLDLNNHSKDSIDFLVDKTDRLLHQHFPFLHEFAYRYYLVNTYQYVYPNTHRYLGEGWDKKESKDSTLFISIRSAGKIINDDCLPDDRIYFHCSNVFAKMRKDYKKRRKDQHTNL
jgi:hypothetical protein